MRAASTNNLGKIGEDRSTITNLAANGGAQSNHNPLKQIDVLIKHHKPNLPEACDPDKFYKNQARINPKHI